MAGRQIVVDIVGDASKFTKATKDATNSATKLGSLFGSGLGLGAGIAAFGAIQNVASDALSAVVDFGVGSIQAASDMNETLSKSQAIFGKNADEIEKWADTAAVAFGSSKKNAIDTASGFAGLFDTVGIAANDATKYAKDLTVLGSDLASFFNTDVESATAALKSGLSGESEPLRKFNVFLSETAVSAKLASMGIKKVGGQFTEAQKATARYALIMEQTSTAQGDFGRTSDGLANSQRTLTAQMDDLQATIGQELLPVALELTRWAKDDLVPVLTETVAVVRENKDAFGFLAEAFNFARTGGMSLTQSLFDQAKAAGTSAAGVSTYANAFAASAVTVGEASADMASDVGTATRKVTGHTRNMYQSYADFAGFMLGKYNEDIDKALGIHEARVALNNAKTAAERVEQYAEIERLGDLSQKDYANWINALKDMARGTKGQVHAAYMAAIEDVRALRAAANKPVIVSVKYVRSGSGITAKPQAAGGPSPANGYSWVGESGPELVRLPAGSYVHPAQESARMAGSSGGGTTVNINVSTPLMTPGGADALAAAIMPAVTRSLQRQQSIPRR